MLTTWGKRIVSTLRHNYGIPSVTVSNTSPAMIEAKKIDGVTVYIPPVPRTTITWNLITTALVTDVSSPSVGIAVGSSSVVESESDYSLGSQIIGLTAPTATITTTFDTVGMKYVASIDLTISNETGSPVTISEIGMFGPYNTAGTQGNTPLTAAANRACVMLDRTLLVTPVTIANGEAGVVRYGFAF